MTLNADDFKFLCGFIREKSGINLSDDKAYLLDSRLLPVARKRSMENLSELVSAIRAKKDETLLVEVIEAMTTNETSFFRDIAPFNNFRDHIMPHILQKSGSKDMRIWCAACSSGQEPYSLAMTVLENKAKFGDCKVEIVGTDIDRTILKKASEAIYSQFEVQRGLPIQMLMKYFAQQESYGEKWLLKQEVKDMVKFQHLNLLESYDSMGKFDVIFCRNVLIYFESDIKAQILNKLSSCMKSHSLLMLGSAETVTDLNTKLKSFSKELRGVLCLED